MNKKFQNFSNRILLIPRYVKKLIVIFVDILICILSLIITKLLIIHNLEILYQDLVSITFISVFLCILIFYFFGNYNSIFRYIGVKSYIILTRALFLYSFLFFLIINLFYPNIHNSFALVQFLSLYFIFGIYNSLVQFVFKKFFKNLKNKSINRILVYGAGDAGQQIVNILSSKPENLFLGYIDDNEELHNKNINGLNIYSKAESTKIIIKKEITHIFFALPLINKNERLKLINFYSSYPIYLKTLPNINDIIDGQINTNDISDLDIDDLIGRETSLSENKSINDIALKKNVLITGAGGSIGSELVVQIYKMKPSVLILLDINEYNLYEINEKLSSYIVEHEEIEVISLLGSINDELLIKKILRIWRVNIIFHAAAYKHVPIVEYNSVASIKNNVLGSLCLAKKAFENNVSHFIFISTDKAVRPTSVMGATKRLAEISLQSYFQSVQDKSNVKLSIVRFGNVIGSSGSVIPKFREQILNGGPITVTDKEVTRFFMTIKEAVQLVIQTIPLNSGNEIFFLDMGKPVKIYDLAKRLINLSGRSLRDQNNLNGDIAIDIVGLRPGEKLFEELTIVESPIKTSHPKIFIARDTFIPWTNLEPDLKNLSKFVEIKDTYQCLLILSKIIQNFNHSNLYVDHFLRKNKK